MARKRRNTVYSTDPAYLKRCPRCGSFPCRCPKPKSLPPEQQTAGIRREKKGRGGKTVTVIKDLQLTPEDMKAVMGPYLIFQIQSEFKVNWDDGLKMNVPDVTEARSLVKMDNGSWKDTVDGKVYSFAYNKDGSVSGMNILVSTELIKGFTAAFIVDKTLKEDGIEAAQEKFRELWDNCALDLEYTEKDMNDLGYKYLGEDKIEEALMVFELNVEAFPQSWNVYDSYGEALMKNGDKEAAIENYTKSIELNPENKNGEDMLNKLTSEEEE